MKYFSQLVPLLAIALAQGCAPTEVEQEIVDDQAVVDLGAKIELSEIAWQGTIARNHWTAAESARGGKRYGGLMFQAQLGEMLRMTVETRTAGKQPVYFVYFFPNGPSVSGARFLGISYKSMTIVRGESPYATVSARFIVPKTGWYGVAVRDYGDAPAQHQFSLTSSPFAI